MEIIICVCIIATVVLILGNKVIDLAKDYDDAKVSVEHEGKKGSKTSFHFDGKRKKEQKKDKAIEY